MTSMPLTSRRVFCGFTVFGCWLLPAFEGRSFPVRSRLAIRRCAPVHLLVGQVFLRTRLHHWLDDLFIRLVPLIRELPLLAVPGLDAGPGGAHVVLAGGADRPQHAGEAQLVEAFLVQAQVLQAPAHLLAGHDLAFAEALLCAS